MNPKNILSLLLLLALTACDPNRVFDDNQAINTAGWRYNETLNFAVPITDIAPKYNIYINIRHKGDYEYNNLYLIFRVENPDKTAQTNRLNLHLANKQGKWFGTGLGDMYSTQILLKANQQYTQKGTYTYSLSQYMRINQLKNVVNAGIRIEKAS